MKYAFILEWQVAFSVAAMCRVLGVSTSGFYAWRTAPVSKREERNRGLRKKARAAFTASRGTYGSPRVRRELREGGDIVSSKTVAKLMREEGLVARRKRRFRATTDSKHDDPIAPNLVNREFSAPAPNHTWVTDVTCIWTREGWLFLAALIDLYSRRVVGWATSATNDRFLALDALHDAITKRRPAPGLVHHSDRGSPYASDDYREALKRFGLVASMSRKGDCWDNAVAESFFSTLETELGQGLTFESHQVAIAVLGEFIDCFYNSKRRHSFLDYVSPIGFELQRRVAAMAA